MARPKQEDLPMKIEGENDKPIKALTDKAEDYYKAVRVRLRAAGKEAVIKEELMAMMHDEKIEVYRDDDLIVQLTNKENLKVKHESEKAQEED
jgi:hypothetical protein